MARFTRVSILLLAALAANTAFAEANGVPVKIWASAVATSTGGGGRPPGEPAVLSASATFMPSSPGASGAYSGSGSYSGSGAGGLGVSLQNVRMEVGKTYLVTVYGEFVTSLTFSMSAPTGYRMEMDGLIRNRISVTGIPDFYESTYRVRVLNFVSLPGGQANLAPGQSSMLEKTGVFWELGLGSLLNGTSAGNIRISDSALESSWTHLFTTAALNYEPPSTEVTVHRDSSAQLRQIIAPEAVVDVSTASATSYTIKFYHPGQRQGSNYPYTFTGLPFAIYTIEQGGTATTFKITHETRDLVSLTDTAAGIERTEVTTMARTGSWPTFTWTRTDWYSGSTAQTKAVTVSAGTTSARTETTEIQDVSPSTVAMKGTKGFSLLSGYGELSTGSSAGTSNSVSATLDRYTTAGVLGLLKSKVDNGGAWEAYEYYSAVGNTPATLKYVFRPFNGSPATVGFAPSAGEVTYYEYVADAWGVQTRPSLIETKVNNVLMARSAISYADSTVNGMTVVTATRADRTNDNSSHTLTTLRRYYREDTGDAFFRSQTHSVTQPDGVKTSFAYQRGSLSGTTFTKTGSDGLGNGTASRTAIITGTTQSSGNALYQTHDGYDVDDLYLVTNKSTLQVTLRNAQARIARVETYVWTGSAWSSTPVAYEEFAYDWNGRLEQRQASNGALHTYTWSGDHKETETDATGVKLTYHYDAAGRVDYVEKESGGPLAYPQRTTFTYSAAGQVLTETLSAPGGSSETIQTARVYDDAGRLTSIDPPSAKVGASTISYDPVNRKRTTTAPDGGTKIEETQIDGRLVSITGTAVVSQFYTYGVETDGRRYTQVNSGTSSSVRWSKAWVDWLGRPVKTERPGFSQSSQVNFVEQSFYDDATIGPGRLYKTTRTGYAPTRFAYDHLGSVVRSGLDIGDNGLVLASTDRISDTDTAYELISNFWWLTTTSRIYPTANSSTAVTTGVSRTRLTGFTGSVQAESKVTDGEGNCTTTTVSVTRSTKTVTTSTTSDGLSNYTTTTTINGLADNSTGYDGLINEQEYDALGRPWKSVDSRNKTTTTAYYTGTALVETVTDPASVVIQTNDYDTNGRLAWAQNAGGHKVRYAYNTRGQLTHQWGAGAYPLAYGYDSTYGDRTTLSTYRGGSNWDASSWPAGTTGTADTTTWTYDEASSLLWKKTDAAGKYVSYNYNSRGQVWVRTWAREVTTTYGYDSNTGELTGQDYSDSTPDVTFAYNRLGQLDSVTDHTGTWDYVYDAAKPWRQAATPLPSSFYGTRYWIPLYDDSALVGRYKGFRVGLSNNPEDNPTGEIEQVYGFSADSARIISLTTERPNTLATRTFTYAYKRNAPWIRALGIDGMSDFKVERRYEGEDDAEPDSEVLGVSDDTRPLLTKIETKWGSTSVVKFAYTHNSLWQRSVAVQSGTAYADYYPSGGYTAISRHFAYNSRGELETEAFYRGAVTGTPSSGDALPGRRDEYRYDSIGNRATSGQTGSADTSGEEAPDDEYTPNALNQYTQRENNLVPFRGTTPSTGTTVSIPGVTVNQLDRVWAGDLVPANATQAVKGSVTINTTSPTSSENRGYFVPKFAQTFGYDDDGNLTHDSVWDYAWDAENRLITMEHRSEVMGGTMLADADRRRIEFRYDYKGRRVRKIVYDGWNGSVFTTTLSDTKFLYDGWNLIAELTWDTSTSTWEPIRSYTWGLDLTGSPTASGGVGALLQIHDHTASKTLLPAYDGNGNLVALLNDSTGALEAVYEYSSFGQLVRSSGTYADANPFRFSTKFTDAETGLVYYGYRYYSTTLGRFINRDPIEENGGVNLYGICANNAVASWDFMGMLEGWVNGTRVTYDLNTKPVQYKSDTPERDLQPASTHDLSNATTNGANWGATGFIAASGLMRINESLQLRNAAEAAIVGGGITLNENGEVEGAEVKTASGQYYRVDISQLSPDEIKILQSYASNYRLAGFRAAAAKFFAPNNAATTNPTANPNGFRDLSAGQTPVLIDPNARNAGMVSTTAGGPPLQLASFGTSMDGLREDHPAAFYGGVAMAGTVGGVVVYGAGAAAAPAVVAAARPAWVAVQVAVIAHGPGVGNTATSALRFVQYQWYRAQAAITQIINAPKPPPPPGAPPVP